MSTDQNFHDDYGHNELETSGRSQSLWIITFTPKVVITPDNITVSALRLKPDTIIDESLQTYGNICASKGWRRVARGRGYRRSQVVYLQMQDL